MCIGPSLGSYLLKQSGNKFRNIWCSIHNARVFVYNACGQACWPWMTPRTVGSVAHVQYRASWKKRLLESPEKVLGFFLSKRVGTLNDGPMQRLVLAEQNKSICNHIHYLLS